MRTRRNKDEIRCTGCGTLTESVSCHPVTKTGSYCDSCTAQNESTQPLLPVSEKPHTFITLAEILEQRKHVDIRRGDHEPVFQHQVEQHNPVPVRIKNEIDNAYRRDMYNDDYDSNNDPWPTGR